MSSVVNLAVSGEGTGVAQKIVTGDGTHKFTADALPAFGGADTAPSPLFYVLAGLSSCTQVTGSLVAKDLGIKVGEWKVDVHAELDTAVLVAGADGNANFGSISGKVSVQTDADAEKFAKFAQETERRCPISQLYKRSGLKFEIPWENKPL